MDLIEAEVGAYEADARHPWERARLAVVARLIARHVALPAGAAVVDVGCGDTFVVQSLAERYPAARFLGIDSAFSESVIARLSARAHPNVRLAASLDAVSSEPSPALLLLMDVLEHVPDDRAFLREVLTGTRPAAGGHVVITVPSYPRLMSGHDTFLGHYRRYTRATLRALVVSAGLSIVEDGYFFTTLAAARTVQVIKDRLRPSSAPQTGVGVWRGGEGLARLLTGALQLDAVAGMALHRLGIRVPGLSAFAVCRTLR